MNGAADIFSAMLGGSEAKGGGGRTPGAETPPPRRTTRVTPNTVTRVREELAEEAREKERAAFRAREGELLAQIQQQQEEYETQEAASVSLATELADMRNERDALKKECAALRRDLETRRASIADLEAKVKRQDDALAAARAEAEARPAAPDPEALATRDREIARLQGLLADARRETRLHGALLDMPEPFSEKFPGEVREHVVATLIEAEANAESSGRDRRARILEAVLGANPSMGELESRREAVKRILRTAGTRLDASTIAAFEKLGFRYISDNRHHKLEWAGVRLTMSKTPSDYRSNLNSATEICNRVF